MKTKQFTAPTWFWIDEPVWVSRARRELTKMELPTPPGSSSFVCGAQRGYQYALLADYFRDPTGRLSKLGHTERAVQQSKSNSEALWRNDCIGELVWVASNDTLPHVEEYLRGFAHGIKCFRERQKKQAGKFSPLAPTARSTVYFTLLKHVNKVESLRREPKHHLKLFEWLLQEKVVSNAAGEYDAVLRLFNRIRLSHIRVRD
jgi:hypothetical protein